MAEKKKGLLQEFTKGIIKENPVLRLVLGCCATLAVTTAASNAIGMGAATTFVLVCSNAVISLLRKVIPDKVRIPAFITIVAGFVTIVQLFIQAFSPALDDALGVFLPLIVVNCIILGRAEMFASKNSVVDSALDGVGMGLGFTLTLLVMSTIREVLGSGTFAGIALPFFSTYNIPILTQTPGGFFVFGCLIALVARITHGKVKHAATGCGNCPNAAVCGKIGKEA